MNLARAILEQRNQSKDGHWFIGIGTECTSFTELIDSYHEALMASSGPQLTAKYRFYLDVTSLEEKVDNQEGKRTMEILAESVRTGQWAEAKQMIMSLINRYEGKGTIVQGLDSEEFYQLAKFKASFYGIPIITIANDVPMTESLRRTYVGSDQYEAGELIARQLVAIDSEYYEANEFSGL